MATIEAVRDEIVTRGDHGHVISWPAMSLGDDGEPISMVGSAKRSVQISGTLVAATRVTIEGSNNGTDYATLTDTHGNNLVFRAAAIAQVAPLTRFIRPRVSGGSGAESVNVHMLIRKEVR